jgi:hypothetical protein
MKDNPRAFIPDPDISDPLERELGFWVMEARSRRNWSLEHQIVLLKKWNALWEKEVEQ